MRRQSSAGLFRGAQKERFGGNGRRTTNVLPAFAFIVPAENFAAMRAHNAVANTKAQARAFARLLGGEERIEDSLGVG